MPDSKPSPSPLSIYVLFHPDSDEGRELARHLHDWFRLSTDDGDRTEAGLPIWFRSRLAIDKGNADPSATARLSPPIDFSGAVDNVVVVLADHHLVADRGWRHALQDLLKSLPGATKTDPPVLVLPVEVHSSLYQLGFLTAARNSVRIGEALLDTLGKLDAPGKGNPDWDRHVAMRARLLRRAVTDAIARKFVLGRDAKGAPERLRVFLSHAKADGRAIAERLRDSLAQMGQLEAWFDANDLPPGYGWGPSMGDAAAGLAGMVAVLTDAYATRPWCREEVTRARRPIRVKAKVKAPRCSIWRVQPMVAVHHFGSKWSRAMPQLVHVPAIGWDDTAAAMQERTADVVDRFLLEVLLARFYRSIAERVAESALPADTHVAMLTWVPEPWSLEHVLGGLLGAPPSKKALEAGESNLGPPLGPKVGRLVIAYPGHGLRTVERCELERVVARTQRIRRHCGGSKLVIELVSQERLQELLQRDDHAGASPTQASPQTICLSGGGVDRELEVAGIGEPHANDFFVRLARRLLEEGCRIVYGGTLGDLKHNLTKSLIEVARGWVRAGNQLGDRAIVAKDLDQPPFINYSAWPNTRHTTVRHHADLVGMAHFEAVYPPGRSPAELLEAEAFLESPSARVLGADGLTAMRKLTSDVQKFPLRIVLGGKIAGASGWLPGIAEEVECALNGGQLPLVLGGFGGCAKVIADYLADPRAPWPEDLTLAARQRDAGMQVMLRQDGVREVAARRLLELQRTLETFRKQLHDPAGNGWRWPEVAPARVRELLGLLGSTQSLNLLIGIVREIMRKLPAP